jgi:hydroxyethylthiazole kinase-like uncharacterized protein yjeF
MQAIVTPEEMAAIDAAAPEPVDVLIGRAGRAVARTALRMLDGAYGRRVVVVAGKGNNGNDGREAARHLRRRGVRVDVVDAGDVPTTLPPCDLVIDAAYGTGFKGTYDPPSPGGAAVLAVDIPSGVDGLTGEVGGHALAARRTVTFAAWKPGLLLADGAELAGEVEVADIGLDVSSGRAWLVEASDVRSWLPERRRATHKWKAAVWVVAGSPGMTGAAHLAARAAQRAGAGMVRLGSPGVDHDPLAPTEAVGKALPEDGWAHVVLDDLERFHAVVIGPGLGRDEQTAAQVRELVAKAPVPVVVDGDGLTALGEGAPTLRGRGHPTVLTPHEGEFMTLTGHRVRPDRLADVHEAAASLRATILLKGPTTVVAHGGDDPVLVTATGDARLATAGTGDVLSGIIAALLAEGLPPQRAAAGGAFVHGRAGALGWRRGLVAGDLLDHVPAVLNDLLEA